MVQSHGHKLFPGLGKLAICLASWSLCILIDASIMFRTFGQHSDFEEKAEELEEGGFVNVRVK